jgi:hypothetical protein
MYKNTLEILIYKSIQQLVSISSEIQKNLACCLYINFMQMPNSHSGLPVFALVQGDSSVIALEMIIC